MFIGFVRTCNTIQLGYKYLINKIQSVSNIGKCLQVDTTTTVDPSTDTLCMGSVLLCFVGTLSSSWLRPTMTLALRDRWK